MEDKERHIREGQVRNQREISGAGKKNSDSRTSAGSRATGSRPAGEASSSRATGSRPAGGAAGSRPESSSRAAGNRPAGGAASSRPTGSRPAAGGETSVTGANRGGGTRTKTRSAAASRPKSAAEVRARKNNVDQHVRQGEPERRPQRPRRQISSGSIIVVAVIIGVVLALVIGKVMRKNMLRVNQINEDFNLGEIFDINNYFEADSNDAVLTFDDDFAPDELGKYTVKFKVTRGKLSRYETGTINIIDTDSPYISGPDSIQVSVGDEIEWSNYFDVIDEDPDISDKIEVSPNVDTSSERTVTVTISVTDWAGNSSQKEAVVDVVESNFQ
jgi:plastocyanin